VQRIIDAPLDPTGKELRLVVKNLDRLSDVLCGVIDMCELVRNVHPEEEWVAQSDLAYERLCSFMNELNTDRGLYEVSPACFRLTLTASSFGRAHTKANNISTGSERYDLASSCSTFIRGRDASRSHLPPGL
jgi:intermediate peptidase